MLLHDIRPNDGTVRNTTRKGKGPASGQGKTAGRGQTGYGSRSGSKSKFNFEGGQMPLVRRLPKRGFKNFDFRVAYQPVNLSRLECFQEGELVDAYTLYAAGIINKIEAPVKILGDGELTKKFKMFFDGYSKSAIAKIEKSGSIILDEDAYQNEVKNSVE